MKDILKICKEKNSIELLEGINFFEIKITIRKDKKIDFQYTKSIFDSIKKICNKFLK